MPQLPGPHCFVSVSIAHPFHKTTQTKKGKQPAQSAVMVRTSFSWRILGAFGFFNFQLPSHYVASVRQRLLEIFCQLATCPLERPLNSPPRRTACQLRFQAELIFSQCRHLRVLTSIEGG